MANLQNAVTRLQIILVSSSYFAYIQRDILELLRWNFHLTPLQPKRWPDWKILTDTECLLHILRAAL